MKWKCNDLKCVRKPTKIRLSLTPMQTNSAVERSKIVGWPESPWNQSGRKGKCLWKNRRRLRSASSNQLDVPSFRLPTVGSRAFLIAGAKLWNNLPDDVTSAPSLSTFRRHLKTYLFRCCYNTVWYCSYLLWLPRCCLGHSKNFCDDDDDNERIWHGTDYTRTSSGDETANVNCFTTTSYTYYFVQ